MPASDPQVVQRRLEEFRRNLLDTSLRNRLIHFRTRTKAGKPLEKVVEVQGEDPIELVRLLVAEGKALSFVGRPDPRPPKPETVQLDLDAFDDEASMAKFREEAEQEIDAYLHLAAPIADATDLKLNTNDTVSALARKLTKIYRDARVAVEEQGVNVLFLALGSLEWYEADASDDPRRAPLIMLPVSLERTSAGAFRLRWDGSDAGANLSLAAMLKAEFGIRLPEIGDDLDVAAYLRDVERAVASQGRWSVDRLSVALAFFSYAKFLMYRDLDGAAWPADGKPGAHETVGALLDGGFEEGEPGVSEDAFLDPLRPVADVREVYDADGSQTLAILEANTGRTMLIEGPPGTGKSQTITNLIAEAIGAGRKVLFVAEKAAALDVVFRRLREANLGDACLELHSHQANKRSFYGELRRTVGVAAPRAARAEADLKRLEEDRARLNAYAEAINAPLEPSGIAPRDAMGRLVALGPEPSPEGRHAFASMAGWSDDAFRERLDLVRRLQGQVALMGRPTDHPYFGSALDHLLPADRDDLARSLQEAAGAVETLVRSAGTLAEALGVEEAKRPSDVERLRAYAAFVAQAPDVRGVAIRADWTALEPSLREALADGRRLDALKARLTGRSLETDVASLRNLLRRKEGAAEELAPAMRALDAAASDAFGLADAARALATRLGVPAPTRLEGMEPLTALAKRLGSAPDVRGMAVAAPEWPESGAAVAEALGAVRGYRDARARYGSVLRESAWEAEVRDDLAILEAHGGRFFRFLNGAYRRAMASSAAHFVSPPSAPLERVAPLRAVGEAKIAEATAARHRGRLSALFGERWAGTDSDPDALAEAASWIEETHQGGKVPLSALAALERGETPAELGRAGDDLRARLAATTAALGALRERFGDDEAGYAFLLESLRPRLPEIEATTGERALDAALATLDRIAEAQATRERVRAADGSPLGPLWTGEATDWDRAQAALDWTLGLHRSVAANELPPGLVDFFAEECPRAGLDNLVHRAQDDRGAAQRAVRAVLTQTRYDRDPAEITEAPLDAQRGRIAFWTARLDDLPALIRYNALAGEAKRQGLDETVILADAWPEASTRLTEAFERSWLTGVVRRAFEARPILKEFDRRGHEETIREFQGLDDLALRINRARVALAHWQAVPRGAAGGAMGWLGVQFGLNRSHKPVRTAMERAGEAIQAIKPVFLMSPLSVAMFLPADGPRFDLVVFDEASQVKPEDAFGGILRARQTIVVGDSKQMPPTSFFDKLTSEETDDEEGSEDDGLKELESVLAMMSAKLPARTSRRRDLRWHYRSRHDALIATSNRLFYDDRLVVFPSPWRGGANAGLVLRHDPATVYGRGGSRKNPLEARAVAQAALKHVREHPKLTLGVAAFSKPQQEAIQDELDLLRRNEPAFAAFDVEHPFEPLFVKNLENVQGDERDVILISVGYGRDENGFVSASFGPLNREGGERRLNVLITRARVRCEVFTSLKADDVRLTDRPARGVMALKTFLAFADTGSLDVPAATGNEPQSPFEEAVLARLRAAGHDVEPQVGSCGFFIDLAVRHPEQPQRFVLGIECDGAMYHRARSARDRDKLRQGALESRGWRIHRIWSTDWFQNADREFERLTAAIAAATAATGAPDETVSEDSARPSAYVELERDETLVVEEGVEPYRLCALEIDLGPTPLHLVPPSQLAAWVAQVVATEGPVHLDETIRRIREAAGVGQAGPRIRAAIEDAVALAEREGRIVLRDEFLHDPAQETVPIRSRAGLPPAAKRLEMVSPEEATEALARVVARSFGIEPDEAAALAARSLGFERTTVGMAERLRALIERAVADGRFVRDGDRIRLAPAGA